MADLLVPDGAMGAGGTSGDPVMGLIASYRGRGYIDRCIGGASVGDRCADMCPCQSVDKGAQGAKAGRAGLMTSRVLPSI